MRRAKRRLTQLLAAIILITVGAGLTLALYPLLPEGFKQSVEDLKGKATADFKFRNDPPIVDKRSPTNPPALIPTPTAPRLTRNRTATPVPTTQRPTPTPTSTPTPRPTFTPTPAPTRMPLKEQREYLLELINNDRALYGLESVALGSNSAAQEHAEEMLEYSYVSHWGLDGLTPYMRYALAGGLNYEAENAHGMSYSPRDGLLYATINPRQEIGEAETSLMGSPGHRRNILNPVHKKVNLGIACNRTTCAVVQQFEGDYIRFENPPILSSGVLSVAGKLLGGFKFSSISVWYDQPPHPLTLGQLDRTYSYNTGEKPAAFLRPPLSGGQYYPDDRDVFSWQASPSPYDISPDVSRLEPGFAVPLIPLVGLSQAPWITALSWEIAGASFNVQADLSEVIDDHGPGVYTVLVWGTTGEQQEDVVLSKYSIFLEAE